ncbi:hypothetical protein [Streptomyces sp. NPDC001389]|uniref:hypothetical protein n=1 Tax=Streptomyces sp. NPDC001389 TaxID=3364569 RepID=UPI0036A94363
MVVLLALVWLFLPLPLPLSVTGLAAGLAWSAATHAVLDRRWPVRWLLQRTGSPAALAPASAPDRHPVRRQSG